MKTKSCYSQNLHPYRAGIEIGEKISNIHPEVIFLFSSIHYNGSPLLLEGIHDVLEGDDIVLIGNTGDGFYEKEKVCDVGVSALGINSLGRLRWHLAHESGIKENPFEATQRCLSRINRECSSTSRRIYFIASDFRTDTSRIIASIRESACGPVVGGLAGDDHSIKTCFVYAGKKVLTNNIAILAIEGDVPYEILIAHNLQGVGKPGVITESSGPVVRSIDNIPVMAFLQRELGKPLNVVDEGTLTFRITNSTNRYEQNIRSMLLPEDNQINSSIRLFGGVEEGDHALVCLAPPKRIIQDIKDVAESFSDLPFKPAAALIVSCAGRKKVLGGIIDNEVKDILLKCDSLEAIAGFPSFGEFGPVKTATGYSKPLFHNMTFVLLLIGIPES